MVKNFDEWTKAQAVRDRWAFTGLFNGVPEERQVSLAACLEGQRLHNEQIEDNADVAQLKRVSIPIMRRIFPACAFEGSIQSCNEWHTFHGVKFDTSACAEHGRHNLQREADHTAEIAQKLAEAINEFSAGRKLKVHCLSFDKDGSVMINYET